MATVAQNATHQVRGPARLLMATYGTFPNEAIGYTDGDVSVEVDSTYEEDVAQECVDPISKAMTKRSISISVPVAQINTDNLTKILGVTPDGSNFGLSGEPEETELAALVVAVRDDYSPIVIYLPRTYADGKMKLGIGRGKALRVPITLKSLRAANGTAYLRGALDAATVTIASDAGVRVNTTPGTKIAHCKFAGEGAAADALTDITAGGGTALIDGEYVFCQINAVAAPITVTHAGGTLETTTAANFVMTKLTDWILLRYDLANTKWIEVARRDTE